MNQTGQRSKEWNPFIELQGVVTDLFDEVLGAMPTGASGFGRAELRKTEQGDRVVVAVPGVEREEIELTIDERVLVLSGERRATEIPQGAGRVRRERSSGRFRRVVRLREPVDTARVTAQLDDGLLTIDLPRPERAEPREIPVEAEEA